MSGVRGLGWRCLVCALVGLSGLSVVGLAAGSSWHGRDLPGRPVAAVEVAVPVWAYTREELLERFGPKAGDIAQRIGQSTNPSDIQL